jgi:hypothetical protein
MLRTLTLAPLAIVTPGKSAQEIDQTYDACMDLLAEFQELANLPSKEEVQETAAISQDSIPVTSQERQRFTVIEKNFSSFGDKLSHIHINRRVFRTSKDHLGLGPKRLLADDQIWLFSGAKIPYVLRPTEREGCFTLVGEAYVHGYSNGEMLGTELKDRFGPVYLT